MDTLLKRAACAHAALSTILNPAELVPSDNPRRPPPAAPLLLSPILDTWTARLANQRGNADVLLGIHRQIAAVRQDIVELRTAKQRLEQMLAEGTFAFTSKVDPTSFKILCAILSEGDVAKAGRALGIGDPMMRKILRQWRHRGAAYCAMLDLVRWRKRIGRRENLPLNDAILHECADATDYPGILSDVLDGLLSMTDSNWADLCAELADLLRPAVAAAGQSVPSRSTPVRTH